MQQTIRHTYYVILTIFAASAVLCICGLGYKWFYVPASAPPGAKDLPYLGTLVTSILVEAAGVVIVFVKSGLKYLPEVATNKTEEETFKFMAHLLTRGTSVTIVSNRVSLLTRSEVFRDAVVRHAKEGTQFEFITPKPLPDKILTPLQELGVHFYVTGEGAPPEARFTLINADRAGGETLAIARGTHPSHEITIFDTNSGPQMIAMAKDIIKKSKLLSHAP
jgi:hypothetical protein